MPVAVFAILLAVTAPFQVRFTTCPLWQVVRRDTIWADFGDSIAANPLSLTSYRGSMVAIAGHVQRDERKPSSTSFAGIVVGENGARARVLERPEVKTPFESPLSVVDSRGRVHVIWGVRRREYLAHNSVRDHLAVWYARWDRRKWSSVMQLPGTDSLVWPLEQDTPITIDARDRVHLVLAAQGGPTQGAGIVHYELERDRWRSDTLSLPTFTADPTISVHDDIADIAYISPRSDGSDGDDNSLWVTSLDLRLRTFGARTVVRSGEGLAANYPRFLRARNGMLSLAWVLRNPGDPFFNEIGAARRLRSGRWQLVRRTASLPLAGASVQTAAIDGCGTLHLLVSLFVDELTSRFVVLSLRRGEWLPPKEIPVGMTNSGRAHWAAATDGSPRVVLAATPWTRDWGARPAPAYWLLYTVR